MIKVSVIVPMYNVEKYLKKAIDSLLNQTLKETEIILVDDGSPDNCGKIIDEYAGKYSNVIAIHKENGGLSDARNAGIAVAKGEYIGFVDPDDYAEPEMFLKLYETIENDSSDLAICGYKCVFSEKCISNCNYHLPYDILKSRDYISRYISGEFGAYVWNKLWKASIIKEKVIKFPKGIQFVSMGKKKVESLLKEFGISDRIFSTDNSFEDITKTPIDYKTVNAIINEKKSNSQNYLGGCING